MSDIVSECRDRSDKLALPYEVKVTLLDAAAEIERLRAGNQNAALEYLGQTGQLSDENTRLRAALQAFADAMNILSSRPGITMTEVANVLNEVGAKARAALKGK